MALRPGIDPARIPGVAVRDARRYLTGLKASAGGGATPLPPVVHQGETLWVDLADLELILNIASAILTTTEVPSVVEVPVIAIDGLGLCRVIASDGTLVELPQSRGRRRALENYLAEVRRDGAAFAQAGQDHPHFHPTEPETPQPPAPPPVVEVPVVTPPLPPVVIEDIENIMTQQSTEDQP